ncbi:hypothetical protein JCM8202v2_005672 [Rhodotorula sphaerocarpa]
MVADTRGNSAGSAQASTTGSGSTGDASSASSTSPSLLTRVKRRISTVKLSPTSTNGPASHSLASIGRALLKSGDSPTSTTASPAGSGPQMVDEPKSYMNFTIAPPDHREFPFRSNGQDSPGLEEDGESDDGDSAPPTPPANVRSAPPTRRSSGMGPSLSPPPRFPRRSSDPKVTGAASPDPIERLYGNVVMLGGYRGSVLRDAKSHKRLWIPLKVGFGFRKADLGIGLEEEDELRSAETVIATSMLAQVGGWIDLGKKLKERLKQASAAQLNPPASLSLPFASPPPSPPAVDPLRPPLRFHSWGYDWRRSLELSSEELVQFLERLKLESAARGEGPNGEGLGATVIAHSMGGLVLLHALARAKDPTIIRGIVFAGTPWQGCINTLGPLRLGGGVAFNAKIGTPDICFSWRSGFYFLPRPTLELAAITPRTSLDTRRPEGMSLGERKGGSVPDGLAPPVAQTLHVTAEGTKVVEEDSSTPTLPPSSPDSMPLPSLLTGCFEDPSGNPIQVDLFDPKTWATHELSPVPAGMDFSRPRAPVKRPRKRPDPDGNPFPLAAGLGNLGERKSPLGDAVQDAMEGAHEAAEAVSTAGHGPEEHKDDDDDDDEEGSHPSSPSPSGTADPAEVRDEEEERLAKQAQEVQTVHEYLKRTLGRARQFQRDLVDWYDPAKADRYPPMTILTSRKTPTVRGVLVSSREAIAQEGYERLLWAEGDGIVLYESSTRLPGDPELDGRKRTGDPLNDRWHAHLKGVVETSNGHVGMLGDLDGVRQCFELLYGPATSP